MQSGSQHSHPLQALSHILEIKMEEPVGVADGPVVSDLQSLVALLSRRDDPTPMAAPARHRLFAE